MKLWELLSAPTTRIDELMNQPFNWEWRKKTSHGWIATFESNKDRFEVVISVFGGITDIMFMSRQSGLDISGNGESFQIFATVIEIARDFVKLNDTQTIRFTAKEASRTKLYQRFANMTAKELGWKVRTENKGDGVYFYVEPSNTVNEDGKIIPGVNTTVDVQPGETERQAAKFGNVLDAKSRPPLLRGSYGDDSARFSANQGDPFYGSDGKKLTRGRK
jgi:hypothetical protein